MTTLDFVKSRFDDRLLKHIYKIKQINTVECVETRCCCCCTM